MNRVIVKYLFIMRVCSFVTSSKIIYSSIFFYLFEQTILNTLDQFSTFKQENVFCLLMLSDVQYFNPSCFSVLLELEE